MNAKLSEARDYLRRIEQLTAQKNELLEHNNYIPREYNEREISETIEKLSKLIEGLQNSIDGYTDESSASKLDEAIAQMEELISQRDNFEKYRELNEESSKLTYRIYDSLEDATTECCKAIFTDSLNNSESLGEFINNICLNSRLQMPFMVALLIKEPSEIYNEIINYTMKFSQNEKDIIKAYIENQKRRIDHNLILSDIALISLLETTTGKNIKKQEKINSRFSNRISDYRRLVNRICIRIYGKRLTTLLTTMNAEDIINRIKALATENQILEFNNLSSEQIRSLYNYIEYAKNNLELEVKNEQQENTIAISSDERGRKYDILRERSNMHSLNGKEIKRFKEGEEFLRTIDDMQASNFPTKSIENYIGEAFSSRRVPREIKQEMIAITLENLELCYSMFKEYYMLGDESLSSYIVLSNNIDMDLTINQPLNDRNIPHLLGIPKSEDLPNETLEFLGLDPNNYYSAFELLEIIINNKEKIINESICGCYRKDGALYEMLPWEKIILKCNAFVRGDFFKSTSLITTINPDSYLISPDDPINAIAISSSYFSESPTHQKIPKIDSRESREKLFSGKILEDGRNSLYQKNKDLIIKGLIADFTTRLIQTPGSGRRERLLNRISGVVTNESFIGERLKYSNGTTMRTMNKPSHLLSKINPDEGGVTVEVENSKGETSFKSLSENIILLEDVVLATGNVNEVQNLAKNIIGQLESIYTPSRDIQL